MQFGVIVLIVDTIVWHNFTKDMTAKDLMNQVTFKGIYITFKNIYLDTWKMKYTIGAHTMTISKNTHKVTKTDYVWFEFLRIRR